MYKHANGQPGNFKVYDKYHFRSYGGLTGGTYSFHTGREGVVFMLSQWRFDIHRDFLDWSGTAAANIKMLYIAKIMISRIFGSGRSIDK